eukprot:4380638-Lingulodinium_polyedra.AAC.1
MQWPARFRHDTPEAEDYWRKTWEAYSEAGSKSGSGTGASSGASAGKRPAASNRGGGDVRRLLNSEMPAW